jgi:hypothetical protein
MSVILGSLVVVILLYFSHRVGYNSGYNEGIRDTKERMYYQGYLIEVRTELDRPEDVNIDDILNKLRNK